MYKKVTILLFFFLLVLQVQNVASLSPESVPEQASMFSYPADPVGDISWSAGTSGVNDIQTAFNHARSVENSQLGTFLPGMVLPSQAIWGSMSDGEKALWLINQERVARDLDPLDDTEENVGGVAQYYADYLFQHNAWGHYEDGNSPWDRLNNNSAIGSCHDFLNVAENLAVFVTSGNSIDLPIERSIFMWMYDDAGSGWGHRHAILWYPYNENGGVSESEGFLGIGRANGGSYQGPFSSSWNFTELIVMNVFDPCESWVYPVPEVSGSVLLDENPNSLQFVRFSVTFSEYVDGVGKDDFSPVTTGDVSGASIFSVDGSGVAYVVTVETGIGSGTIRLDVVDDDTIIGVSGSPLGGVGAGNGNYTNGEMYTIEHVAPPDNDDFGTPDAIDVLEYADSDNTIGATVANDDPSVGDCGVKKGLVTVWYQYRPSSDSAISIDTSGSGYDTFIAVWTGTRGDLTLVACNNNGTGQAVLAFQVKENTLYYIEIGQP